MFQRSIAKNTIRFSFSHSLTSLFFCFFPSSQPTWFSLCHTGSPSLLIFSSLLFFFLIQSDSATTFHQSPTTPFPPASICLFYSLVCCLTESGIRWKPRVVPTLTVTIVGTWARLPLLRKHMGEMQSNNLSSPLMNLSLSLSPPPPPPLLPRGCSVCQYGFCSMTLSECFSTRRTRTASSNREPSDVSAHRPVKCKPSSS